MLNSISSSKSFADSTYSMRFIAEGFEGEGGRSVTGYVNALVSALPYVIGYKADGDLHYIDMNKPRAVDLDRGRSAAEPDRRRKCNPQRHCAGIRFRSEKTGERQLRLRIGFARAADEIGEDRRVRATDFITRCQPASRAITCSNCATIKDRRLSANFISRSLVRARRRGRWRKMPSCRSSSISKQYNPGEDIAISIIAPYAGSGLITIEREKVYTYAWFQATTASSVQHIRLPEAFEGSGYINVSFIRALDSKEIFVSPLSYGVVPFTANVEKRRLKIDLDSAAIVKPGDALHIGYKTDRPSKIVVFAVDQGILQVTDYKTPNPIGYFFRKCALGVETAQIVDLIIPEFSLLRSLSAFGGDGGEEKHLNPFKRVTEKPVVFWSGVLDADPNRREVVYNVPDFFDGTLKIMAVAVSSDTIGSSDRTSLIRGPFVVTPSVPVLAVPGDEFEAGVTVANNVEGSGADAEIELRAETSPQLSVKGQAMQKMQIAEGREKSAVFRFHVNDALGSGEIRFTASRNGTEIKRRATLSVRPAVPFATDVHSGNFKKASIDVPIKRQLYAEFSKRDAAVSATPLGLAHGLDSYLKNFPYGCSEQVTSGAFCRLVLSSEADFGLNRGEITAQMEKTFNILRRRQNAQGVFGYWAAENGEYISFNHAYVMDFLSEAKAAGFPPPAEMFASGLRSLQRMVAKQPEDIVDARRVAYGIYVLTREGVITTNYILNLQDYLNKKHADEWQNDLTGVYLAGSLKLLHKDKEAEALIDKFKIDNKAERSYEIFCQPLGSHSQYITVLARQFPAPAQEDLGQPVRTSAETDRRRTVQHAVGGLCGSSFESVLPRDRAKSAATDDRRSPRGQTRSQPGQRREVVAKHAILERRDGNSIQERAAAWRTGRVLSGRRGRVRSPRAGESNR